MNSAKGWLTVYLFAHFAVLYDWESSHSRWWYCLKECFSFCCCKILNHERYHENSENKFSIMLKKLLFSMIRKLYLLWAIKLNSTSLIWLNSACLFCYSFALQEKEPNSQQRYFPRMPDSFWELNIKKGKCHFDAMSSHHGFMYTTFLMNVVFIGCISDWWNMQVL